MISTAGTTAAMSWNACFWGGEHSHLSRKPMLAKGISSSLSPSHHSKLANPLEEGSGVLDACRRHQNIRFFQRRPRSHMRLHGSALLQPCPDSRLTKESGYVLRMRLACPSQHYSAIALSNNRQFTLLLGRKIWPDLSSLCHRIKQHELQWLATDQSPGS